MTNNRVLYISYDGMTDPLGQSQVIPYLIGLSKAGYEITIISCEKPQARALLQQEIKDLLIRNNITWHPIAYTKSPPVLSTLYDIWNIRQTAFILHRKNNFSIVHCRSYISSLVGLRMKKKFGIKFIFDMRGFWADERVEGNIWNLKNPIFKTVYNFFKKKEKEFLLNADFVISLTQNAKEEIHSWKLSEKEIKIEVIPCCVDMDLFNPQSISTNALIAIRESLGINANDFVLSYIGSLGTWYLCDEMLQFFKTLLTKKPQSKFLFITGEPKEYVLSMAVALNIPTEKIIVRKAQRKEMPLFIRCSNVSVFFIKPSYSKKASSPVKQGEVMSMGVPIICNDVGDTGRIINTTQSGLVLHYFSEATFNKAASEIDVVVSIDLGVIRNAAAEYYSLPKGIEKYKAIYHLLTS